MAVTLYGAETATYAHVHTLLKTLGNRSRDFIRCFDITSIWCHRYAYIVLQGFLPRGLITWEQHHIVPVSYYRSIGLPCSRRDRLICRNNLTELTIKEHIFAHYCMVHCCTHIKTKRKLIRAFYIMFYGVSEGNRVYNELCGTPYFMAFTVITEQQVLDHLSSVTFARKPNNLVKQQIVREYRRHPKYPIAVIYTPPLSIYWAYTKHYNPITLVNRNYCKWLSRVLLLYARYVRMLAIEHAIKKNVRFSDYILRPVPTAYKTRLLSVEVCHRLWCGSVIATLDYIDSYLGASPIPIELETPHSPVIQLGYNSGLSPQKPGCPSSEKPKRPIRYARHILDTVVCDEPIVMLHGCGL